MGVHWEVISLCLERACVLLSSPALFLILYTNQSHMESAGRYNFILWSGHKFATTFKNNDLCST